MHLASEKNRSKVRPQTNAKLCPVASAAVEAIIVMLLGGSACACLGFGAHSSLAPTHYQGLQPVRLPDEAFEDVDINPYSTQRLNFAKL